MKLMLRNYKRRVLFCASSIIVLAAFSFAVPQTTRQLTANQKATVMGEILSRNGDLIQVMDKRSGEVVVVKINDSTKVERKQSGVSSFRQPDMDVTALVPGLALQADGLGNAKGQLDAATITFDANSAAMLNHRVSDLQDYKNEFEVDVFFAYGSAVLDETAIRDLANLADIAKSLNGYMIEISGYSSNRLTSDADQKLSEQRAAAVAHYFREVKNIPMRRVLAPVGHGSAQPVANNRDAQGRELNRRVDVRVLVNTAPGQPS